MIATGGAEKCRFLLSVTLMTASGVDSTRSRCMRRRDENHRPGGINGSCGQSAHVLLRDRQAARTRCGQTEPSPWPARSS